MANARGTVYASEYYNNVLIWNSATRVNVTAGEVTSSIDFSLSQGSSFSGRVENQSGNPISGARISATNYYNGTWFSDTQSGSDGSYYFDGLPPGDYRVEVDPWDTPYLREYYNNRFNWDDAAPVTVIPGDVTPDIDFTLDRGGVISGRVLDLETGSPVEDKIGRAHV